MMKMRNPKTGAELTELVTYLVPLRADADAVLYLPKDITAWEVQKLTRLISTLRIPTPIEKRRKT